VRRPACPGIESIGSGPTQTEMSEKDILNRYFKKIFWKDFLERYFREILWKDIFGRYFEKIF
jgi:hypothetical protein